MFELTEKAAMVIGGAGYLAKPVCDALAEQGASVAVADYDLDGATELAEKLNAHPAGNRAEAFYVDVRDTNSVHTCLQRVAETFGQLDILVNATYVPHGDQIGRAHV